MTHIGLAALGDEVRKKRRRGGALHNLAETLAHPVVAAAFWSAEPRSAF